MRRALLAGLAALCLGGAGLPDRAASLPLSRADLPWWRARLAQKAAELRAAPRVDLVWYGDSITQDWERKGPAPWGDFAPVWQHYYGGRHALDMGFNGDATSHLLWRIENGEAAGIHPRVAVVLIGANNFGHLHWGGRPDRGGHRDDRSRTASPPARHARAADRRAALPPRRLGGPEHGGAEPCARRPLPERARGAFHRPVGSFHGRWAYRCRTVSRSPSDPARAASAPDGANPGDDGRRDRAKSGRDAGRHATPADVSHAGSLGEMRHPPQTSRQRPVPSPPWRVGSARRAGRTNTGARRAVWPG